MDKYTEQWPVTRVAREYAAINFPEYQREPNVWARDAKQRLIDSMVRRFDIASIYLYVDEDGSIDCIDGRQRLNAIMSFLKKNPQDTADNGFVFKVRNEIYTDISHPFGDLSESTYEKLEQRAENGEPLAREFVTSFLNYEVTVVSLKGSREPEEFNLQFTRLNLGTIINSGEKLNAMVGELRNICFDELGRHPFFQRTRTRTRRFGTEQAAAQVITQVLSLEESGEYTRTRHFDLQKAFKHYAVLADEDRQAVESTRSLLDLLAPAFAHLETLRNRAITVSAVLLARDMHVATPAEAEGLARFFDGFLCRLQWQVKKGIDVDPEYRHLIDFQRHLTQASVEKSAVAGRIDVLREEFEYWRGHNAYRGDADYRQRTKEDPGISCRGTSGA